VICKLATGRDSVQNAQDDRVSVPRAKREGKRKVLSNGPTERPLHHLGASSGSQRCGEIQRRHAEREPWRPQPLRPNNDADAARNWHSYMTCYSSAIWKEVPFSNFV
jgi:hypothetical protein